MKQRPVSLALVIIYGIAAALWLVTCVMEFAASGEADGLRILCAVVWIIGFFVLLGRYLRYRKEK